MIRLSDEDRQLIGFFEEESGATVRDCVRDDDRVVFVVAAGEMADAIGPQGRTVSRIEDRVNRRVELVEDADDPATFVANALRPAPVYDVSVGGREDDDETETVAYAEVNAADFGAAIGRDGRNIEMAERLTARHFDVDAVELVPEPESVVETVAEEAGTEPVDALFDADDERVVVLAPAGSREEIATEGDALRTALGWPVVVVGYASDAPDLLANALAPADVTNVTVSDSGVAYVEVPEDERGLAIGTGGKRIRLARLLGAAYYGLDDVELT